MTAHLRKAASVGALTILATAGLAGCVAKADVSAGNQLTVTSTDTTCEVSAATATSGGLTFTIENKSSKTSEFYVLAADGLRIVGEVENIAQGQSRTLSIVAQPGDYFTLCKPGMIGEGVGKSSFTVTGKKVEVTGKDAEQKQQAVDLYAAFVKDQVDQLVPAVDGFTADYIAGKDDDARKKFAQVRAFYERIEPVAEALPELDPAIDFREVDAVAEGRDWTGFHRIEKDLWVPAKDALNADKATNAWQNWQPSTPEQRKVHGDKLIADVAALHTYVHGDDFTKFVNEQGITGISNGAIALLDEVAKGKIQGEEDWWSGTDLSDFAANVEGSKMAFTLVRDFADSKGEEGKKLVGEVDRGYAHLESALAQYGSLKDGFVDYKKLTDANKKELTDLLNALAEPLSQLTTTILG